MRSMEPRERIQKLLVQGDNRLKQGHDARAREKARESYAQALAVATENGLEDSVRPLVEKRLADLGEAESLDPLILGPGGGETIAVGTVTTTLKATGATTGGAFLIAETTVGPEIPGPPPHFHRERHDVFFVLEGTLTVRVGDETLEASAGALVCVPPGVTHTFSNPGTSPVRFLNFNTPAGGEDYLRELAAAIPPDGPPDPKVIASIMARHDVVAAD